MRRWLLACISLGSLVLCVGTAGLWVRSYFHSDWATWTWLLRENDPAAGDLAPGDSYYALRLGDGTGCLAFGYGHSYGQNGFPLPRWMYTHGHPIDFRYTDGPLWGRLGLTWDTGPDGLMEITAPFLPLTLILAVMPLVWIATAIRRRRLSRNHVCLTCGYDLRATRDRCPECGTPIIRRAEVT